MKITTPETATLYLPQAVALFFCLAFTEAASTAALSIGDFSMAGLLTQGSESIRKVELPYQVLNLSQQAELSDIRVFDANNQPVPGKILRLSSKKETLDTQIELPFFPFGSNADSEAIKYTFAVERNPDHAEFTLQSNGTTAGAELTKTNYIVRIPEASLKDDGKLNSLMLDWEAPRKNFIVPIKLETSSDLKHWKILEEGAAISHLSHGTSLLKKNKITFNPAAERYLRLSWPESIPQFNLSRITGVFTRNRRTPIEVRHHTITCHPTETANSCELEIAPNVPVKGVKLLSDEPEYFYQARVYSRRTPAEPWRERQVIQAYRLSVEGQEVTNSAFTVPASTERFWKLEFEEPVSIDREQFPRLEIDWNPVYQVFLAQGREPFRLAVSSSLASASSSEVLTDIMHQAGTPITEIERVYLGPLKPIEIRRAFWTRQRIETYLLWFVLLLGVALMFRIALGLFRKLDTHSSN